MRIFLVSNMYPSKADKLYGVFVKNMYTALKKQGAEFPYKALIRGRAESRGQKIKKYLGHYFRIFSFFFKKNYDFLYLHYLSHHVPILWLLLPFKRKPWVVNVHGTDIEKDLFEHPKLDYLARKVLKKIDLLVVPSDYFRMRIMENYPFFKAENIFVSPSGGLDLTHFYPSAQPREPKEITIGFVSRFDESKGWKTYLDALAILKERKHPFKGMIIGKGPDEEGIKTGLKKRDLQRYVKFVGFVKQTDLVQYFHQMDLYIFPSYRESLGLTGLEAMACGTPVMASAIPALKTYIDPPQNGMLFETQNPIDLADQIEAYWSKSAEEKKEISKNAFLTAQAYERAEVAKKLQNRLEKLI